MGQCPTDEPGYGMRPFEKLLSQRITASGACWNFLHWLGVVQPGVAHRPIQTESCNLYWAKNAGMDAVWALCQGKVSFINPRCSHSG